MPGLFLSVLHGPSHFILRDIAKKKKKKKYDDPQFTYEAT